MTNQEMFDRVVAHARAQKRHAISHYRGCLYHGSNGVRCFIGALIPDDKYKPELEGQAATSQAVQEAAGYTPEQVVLALRLQSVHDQYAVPDWEKRFRSLAAYFNLTYTPPHEHMV